MRIALLDDDSTQTKWVKEILEESGHSCHEFNDSKEFISRLRVDSFDLLILDWNIPEISGPEVLAWVRQNIQANVPVIFMTNRTREEDIVAGLNAGADDYIFKPARRIELLARVNAVLRRVYPSDASEKEIHFEYTFLIKEKKIFYNTQEVELTHKEFDLALLLFRHLSRPLSRSHILEIVWGKENDIPTRTMDTHISRIRNKLELRTENGFKLATVYSYGYRLEHIDKDENTVQEL
jgi:DNA-binding response OmpR family regulator